MQHWTIALFLLPLVAATVLAGALAAFFWARRAAPGARPAAVLMLAVLEWSSFYLLELVTPDLQTQLFWVRWEYLGIVIVPVAWLAFALEFTGRREWVRPPYLVLASLVPFATVLMVWTNDAHHLFYAQVQQVPTGALFPLSLTYGPWFWAHIGYVYAALLVGGLLLVRHVWGPGRAHRRQVVAALLSALGPCLGSALYLLRWMPTLPVDLTPFGFALSGPFLAWAVTRLGMFRVVPLARETVVQELPDGLLVLNHAGRVADANPVALRILGRGAEDVLKRPLAEVLADRQDLLAFLQAPRRPGHPHRGGPRGGAALRTPHLAAARPGRRPHRPGGYLPRRHRVEATGRGTAGLARTLPSPL